jgi:hypothetical protein
MSALPPKADFKIDRRYVRRSSSADWPRSAALFRAGDAQITEGTRGSARRFAVKPRRSGLVKRHVKTSTDRGRRGLAAGRNLARGSKKTEGPGAHGNPSPSRYQRDHVASDPSGPLLSLVRPVLWIFRSAPRLIRLLRCAAFQSRLHLPSRETGRPLKATAPKAPAAWRYSQ